MVPSAQSSSSNFGAQLNHNRELVNSTICQLLDKQPIDGELKEVLRYALQAPGKRIRSVLVLWCCELVSGQINSDAEIAAAAIEMVHTYSLIHDDLPAMDNDDLRRGRFTANLKDVTVLSLKAFPRHSGVFDCNYSGS